MAEKTCYFFEGSVVVTPANGEPVQISRGELVTFPEGMDCVWEIKELKSLSASIISFADST